MSRVHMRIKFPNCLTVNVGNNYYLHREGKNMITNPKSYALLYIFHSSTYLCFYVHAMLFT